MPREPHGPPDSPERAPQDAETSLYCPRCHQRLIEQRCKLLCPRCGYYMSCADYH